MMQNNTPRCTVLLEFDPEHFDFLNEYLKTKLDMTLCGWLTRNVDEMTETIMDVHEMRPTPSNISEIDNKTQSRVSEQTSIQTLSKENIHVDGKVYRLRKAIKPNLFDFRNKSHVMLRIIKKYMEDNKWDWDIYQTWKLEANIHSSDKITLAVTNMAIYEIMANDKYRKILPTNINWNKTTRRFAYTAHKKQIYSDNLDMLLYAKEYMDFHRNSSQLWPTILNKAGQEWLKYIDKQMHNDEEFKKYISTGGEFDLPPL